MTRPAGLLPLFFTPLSPLSAAEPANATESAAKKAAEDPRIDAREDGLNAVNLLQGCPPVRIVSPKENIYADPTRPA